MMRNFPRSHFEGTIFASAAADAGSSAGAACAWPIDISEKSSAAVAARPRGPAPGDELLRLPRANAYSAAATLGGPTKPAGSPKRSIITAVRSLVLLVTQAPERTA